MRRSIAPVLAFSLPLFLTPSAPLAAQAAKSPALDPLEALYPDLDKLYVDLHQTPELSLHEEKTSAKLAARLKALGFDVTEKVGGHGIVGVLRNGPGPTVLVRTDMDGLPIREATGLPYASTVTTKNEAGDTVPVMHGCGHDIHMTSWVGAAALLVRARDRWTGTLVFVGQPAEEVLQGAEMMIQDGLLARFPKPDFVVGIHDTNSLPAGQIGIVAGPAFAASNAVDITFFGRGGHVVLNDPALTARLASSLRHSLGDAGVAPTEPSSGSEDFGVFGRVAGVPSVQLRVGASEPGELARAKAEGKLPPGPHNSAFAPDRERTIRGGVAAFTLSVLELLALPARKL